ncbi:hypothetical protein EES42_43795 [Streptomyces sp. ADI95-17]|nr:hypothetical protein EES42_43795 [Streptomyces sp. ADI95-17]
MRVLRESECRLLGFGDMQPGCGECDQGGATGVRAGEAGGGEKDSKFVGGLEEVVSGYDDALQDLDRRFLALADLVCFVQGGGDVIEYGLREQVGCQ